MLETERRAAGPPAGASGPGRVSPEVHVPETEQVPSVRLNVGLERSQKIGIDEDIGSDDVG